MLALSAAGAAALTAACSSSDETGARSLSELPESFEVFPRTVLAGDMTTTSVVIAIYVADGAPKTLRVWNRDSGDVAEERRVQPDAHGFVKERIDGLEPGTWYGYAFLIGEAPDFSGRSLVGNVRTLAEEGTLEPITLAFGSCVGSGSFIELDFALPEDDYAPFDWQLTDMAASLDFDLFVHLGDQGYMDKVWKAGGSYEQYLAAWGAYHGGGFRKIYPKAGMVSTWDDHEVVDNGLLDPFTDEPEKLEKLRNGQRAYYRVMPIDSDDPEAHHIWRSYQLGHTVELILLDCRYENEGEGGHLLSAEQLDWFLGRLKSSPCRFICVGTDKPFANVMMTSKPYPGEVERWQGHAGDRARVTDLINAEQLERIIWVTGDIHMNYFGHADETDDSIAGRMYELCCTSGNTNPLVTALSKQQFEFTAEPPHFPTLTFDPGAGTVTVRFYAEDGSVSFEKVVALPAPA